MKLSKVRLFIKPYCGWCHQAIDWLNAHDIKCEVLDVISNADARKEMFHISGQTLTPVLDVDGKVLADFDTRQLETFWKRLQAV